MSARSATNYPRCLGPRGLFIGAATMMCLMILAKPIEAQSTLPPVRYQVQLWTVPGSKSDEPLDMNNRQQTVGSSLRDLDGNGVGDRIIGFLYDPEIDPEIGVDLNEIVVNIPVGWHIRKASAINDVGQIAAYIEPTGSPSLSVLQAVVIDMNTLLPTLEVIPDRGFTVYSVTGNINNFGDVTARYKKADGTWGHYVYDGVTKAISDLGVSAANSGSNPQINDNGVIIGQLSNGNGYRKSLSGGFETFAGLRPHAINEDNAFCGTAAVTTTRPRATTQYAFVYSTSRTLNKFSSGANDLNSSLDSILVHDRLNHRTLGNFKIMDLLDKRAPNPVLTNLICRKMTDRVPGINFPILCGWTSFGGIAMGVHLIPVPAP